MNDGLTPDEVERMKQTDKLSWKEEGGMPENMRRTTVDSIPREIEPLCSYLQRHGSGPFCVRDFGGGNGAVARALTERIQCTVEVYDIDATKFPDESQDGITYHKHDIRSSLPRKPCAVLSRHALHHNSHDDQVSVMQAIQHSMADCDYACANLIFFAFESEEDRDEAQRLFDWAVDVTDSNQRYFSTVDEYTSLFEATGYEVVHWQEEDQKLTVSGFVKERFKLSAEQVRQGEELVDDPIPYVTISTILLPAFQT